MRPLRRVEFERLVSDGPRVQLPFVGSDDSLPESDVAVVPPDGAAVVIDDFRR